MQPRPLIPQPPFDSVIDPTTQRWVTGCVFAVALIALAYSLVQWRRSGKPVFLLLFCGGGAMMAFEPLIDTVGACWFPEVNSWIAFRAYGRPLPAWLCLTYFFYFGIGVGLTWQFMRSGRGRNQLWGLFAVGMVADFILEVILMHFNVYIYYGWQPLILLKFPLWWAPVNSLIVMVCGAVVYRFEDYLTRGWRVLQIVPITLSVSAAINTMAGWPSWLVINTDLGPVATQMGGVATFALSAWFMWLVVEGLTRGAESSHYHVQGLATQSS